MATAKKVKPPKYKMGDEVYSYQNPTVKRKINRINKALEADDVNRYRLTLYDKDGYPKNSNWINEKSLSKRRKK